MFLVLADLAPRLHSPSRTSLGCSPRLRDATPAQIRQGEILELNFKLKARAEAGVRSAVSSLPSCTDAGTRPVDVVCTFSS
jgi:hypothetical protein